ncbi:MAG: chitobiase/beta-hexosaminidase C-terminal domain-containing protein [Bacteroidales bacterium]|nr:chitobiase/beta-hexosaminidase C-terminal domain-containing protein [Bacteroidales bacterium]
MKRKITSLTTAIIVLFLILFTLPGTCWGQEQITWERVTSTQTLFDGGTFIMGYENTAKSGTIVPLRSKDSDATTSANGYFNTGTTNSSSTNGTITMSNLTGVTTSDYEVYITGIKVTENNQQVYKYINIQRNNSSGNYYGATSGGTTSNKGRLYTSGNSNETNLLPEWSSETNNQFKLTANVTGQYKYLKYNTGSPRFAFYNSAGEKIVFYKKVVKHTLTYAPSNYGSIGGVVYNTSTAVASGASVAEGGKVTLTAQADDGYTFLSWSDGSDNNSTLSSTTTNPTTFTMGTADVTITANFVAGTAYTITAQSNNNNYGTVALNGNVITANPAAGYTYASPAYTVLSGAATVEQNGNEFTVTPTSDCTVTINFAAIPTHTATFSVNGETTSNDFYEGQAIAFPANPAAINGKSFVGWYTAEYTNATIAPSYVNTATATMGNGDVTYYAVFANVTTTYSETETEISQTHQYDTWTYSGTTTDKSTYRLFAENAYIESTTFDLSILKEVDVYAGTFGTISDNDKKKVSIVAGSTTWGTASLSTNSATTKNDITSSVSLSGNGQLHIVAGGGDGSNNGIRISKVEIITKKATTTTTNYCTTVVITYSVTYDANGATSGTVPTDNTAYTSGQSVTVAGNTGSLAKTGYAFGGWNTQADGLGTNYAVDATFNINTNTTLYAKWIVKTITGLGYTGAPTKTTYNDGESFDPTGLTVTATYNDESQEDVTESVTWTPDPLTAGTTSVTGTYMEQTVNVSGLTVNAVPGTAANPYTVAAAITYINTLGNNTLSPNDVYVSGIISQVDSYNSTYNSITYWISDNGTTTGQMEVYGGLGISGAAFSAKADLAVGDIVTVKGKVKLYNNTTPEFDKDNQLVSIILVAPTFYPESGAVASGSAISITDAQTGSTIYYTTDNSDPTTSSTVYDANNKPTISAATTIKAIATKSGYTNSEISSATYTILSPAKAPEFSSEAGTYNYVLSVTLSTETEGADIYYTTDGSNPTTSSTKYTGAISVSTTTTIKAIAAKEGMANSTVSEATYTMNIPVINAENVNLTCSATSGSIAYTITNEVDGGVITSAEISNDSPVGWLTVNGSNPFANPIGLTCAANETESNHTAIVTLTYTYNTNKTVTKAITVTQAKRDYAILPFVWAGGVKNNLDNTTGVTTSGLGSDYADANAPYQVKMDGANDYIQIKTDSQPSKVTVEVKMIGGGDTSKIKVQESSNGSSFTDVQELTISGKQNEIVTLTTTYSFATTTRYVKIIKSVQGSNIGVGPITIDISGSKTIDNLAITEYNTITISNGSILIVEGTLTNGGTAANLIIEDGGQLICGNSVEATVKKSIADAGAKDAKDHWYTISAPVHTGSNNYVTIGASTTVNLTNNGAYDMFAYEESSHTWINQKPYNEVGGFDKMYAGQGYMYRNSGNELSFVGNTTVGAVDIALSYTTDLDVADLKGFNLIGNPYTHSIAKGSGKAIDNTKLSTGCYALTNSGTWTIIEDGAEIKPNQGILVEVSEAVADFQIKDINYVAPTPDPGKYKNDNIKFIVESSEYSDAAYAWFDKGYGLTKINHRNESAPMLYIPQDDNNYAIATMTDDTKAFNLNFKAATAGKYTLSYKATGNYNYLHVIDRLTGADVDMLLEGEYSFIGTPKDSENRFIVHLEYMPNYGEDGNDIFAYQSGSDIYVSGQGELQVFDVTGRRVMTTIINGAESINLSAQGVYIFKLNEKVQKIVVR